MMIGKLVTASLVLIALHLGPTADAQTDPTPFTDRAAFNAASAKLTTIDFEAVAPMKGFGKYPVDAGLTVNGINFRTHGGARFGPGIVYVLAGSYAAPQPIYRTGTGAILTWGAPNQPGNAFLEVMLPRRVTAVGTDLWAGQPHVSSFEVTANTVDGKTQTVNVSTQARPASSFVGFTSDSEISSLRFSIPKGQTRLILDNFTFGQKTRAVNDRSSVSITNPRTKNEERSQTTRPSPSLERPPSASRAGQPAALPSVGLQQSPAGAGRGTIAYVRGGTEIRLIEADGTNDRRLWTHPDATADLGINNVAWRPDGKELAFSSSHAAAASLYHADLYAIRPDGTGFRKLTNAPDRGDFARYPKGTVSVTVRNDQPIYQQSQASAGVFIVYVAGADEPQQITLPPGTTKTVLFKSVADFGNTAQAVVAMWGRYRWFTPGVDVQAGRTVKSPPFSITGDGIELLGAFRPVWRSDGLRVSYRTGACTLNSVPLNPPAGEYIFNPLFGGKNPLGSCTWDWGPTSSLANQIIYTENASGDSSIYRIAEGGTHPGTKLTTFTNVEYQLLFDLRWLPDGSGFLFSNKTLMDDSANIFRFDLATRKVTQITRLDNEFAHGFGISPDGQWIVFERATSLENKAPDLWVVRVDGRDLRLLVRNGQTPSFA